MNWITEVSEKTMPLAEDLLVQLNDRRYVVLSFYFDDEFQRVLASDYESYICVDEIKRFCKII